MTVSQISIVVGTYGEPEIAATLWDDADKTTPRDLTGLFVDVRLTGPGGTPIITGAATIVDAGAGRVSWTPAGPTPGPFTTPGTWYLRFIIYDGAGIWRPLPDDQRVTIMVTEL